MDTVVPICAEVATTYERRGLQVFSKDPSRLGMLLEALAMNGSAPIDGEIINYMIQVSLDPLAVPETEKRHVTYTCHNFYEAKSRHDPELSYGILLEPSAYDPEHEYLRHLFAAHYLRSLISLPTPTVSRIPGIDNTGIALRFTQAFEKVLLFDQKGKTAWNRIGSTKFCLGAKYWIERQLPVKMALPAFPCKTTNREKAAVSMPDGAEYEALGNMLTFCLSVAKFYKPGCEICIISDGHVFSDCIGADDQAVTDYSSRLKVMLKEVESQMGVVSGRILFKDLNDLLNLDDELQKGKPGPQPDDKRRNTTDRSLSLPINHPVTTQIDSKNDFGRRLLLALYSPPKPFTRDLIETVPEHHLTALYRGFSRFMFEDLAFHSDFREQTKSQRKKAAEKVALEMILRNQAYSRLVEHSLPKHIRLSIHAHDNAGPKFAVRLLPAQPVDPDVSNLFKSTTEEAIGASADQELHIPTPWHNTLAEVHDEQGHKLVVCKARIITQALKEGFFGGYDRFHPRGGRFMLWQTKVGFEKATTSSDLSPTIAIRENELRLSEHDLGKCQQ